MSNSIKPGTMFSYWKVLRKGKLKTYETSGPRQYYFCKCTFNDCGKVKEIVGRNLIAGKTKSCGCWDKRNKTTHGMTKHPLYTVLRNMKKRCNNETHMYYANYGGRGIKICKEWNAPDGFNAFKTWNDSLPLSKQYKPGLEIDRKHNDKNYTPKNCRWVSKLKNRQNTRKTVSVTVEDKVINFIDYYNKEPRVVSYATAFQRIRKSWRPEDAVSIKSRKTGT